MVLTREEVTQEDRWNIEAFYSVPEDWETDFSRHFPNTRTPRWPELIRFKGKLGENPNILKDAIEGLLGIERNIDKLYTYAHLRHDENIGDDQNKICFQKITDVYHAFAQETAWFVPELLALPEEKLSRLCASPTLEPYRFHLEKILRLKEHTLSADKEELLALAGKALDTPHKAFSAINDADFSFGKIIDSHLEEHELTHASYGIYLRDQDRNLRKNAFQQYHKKYLEFENTLCELLNGQVQSHLVNARAREYNSCMEAALFPHNIEPAVYHALIQAVNAHLAPLHRYMKLRKKILGIDELHLYDQYVPLSAEVDIKMSYKQAEEAVIESVAPLGHAYQNALKKGLQNDRWVDRYENRNKRSGAYSSGCFDSMPYILMNYKGILRDVFTLAHEAGHSMHSLLSKENQPFCYSKYPIFLAEVASTFNEELLTQLLLQRLEKPEEKIFLINQKIEDIRATLFRQTLFAEFELLIHGLAEKGSPVTPALLKREFKALNAKYFGKIPVIDDEIDIEWARIPHFYYNFYVYQYATGISAALALTEKVTRGGAPERDAYLSFLQGGSSRYPIELLKLAGVDMRTPEPVVQTIHKFDGLIGQLENLLEGKT